MTDSRMMRNAREEDDGFSLIELLVVTLVVGLLAAIALPTFLGQTNKADDASAKSDARNLVTQVESCFADTEDYRDCQAVSELPGTGLNLVNGIPAAGELTVSDASRRSYTITAVSRSGNTFIIERPASGGYQRTCTGTGTAGCPSDGSW